METNLEKAKRLMQANANIMGIELPEDGYIFKMLELAATVDGDVADIIYKEMAKDNIYIKKSEKHTYQFKEGYAEAFRNLAIIIKEVK